VGTYASAEIIASGRTGGKEDRTYVQWTDVQPVGLRVVSDRAAFGAPSASYGGSGAKATSLLWLVALPQSCQASAMLSCRRDGWRRQ
jgi:hypothetical protein